MILIPPGKIDTLTEDKKSKDFTVNELKRGQRESRHLEQLLRYVGWIRSKLAENNDVFGLLIASNFKDYIYFAVK